jgi:hypothetical protein
MILFPSSLSLATISLCGRTSKVCFKEDQAREGCLRGLGVPLLSPPFTHISLDPETERHEGRQRLEGLLWLVSRSAERDKKMKEGETLSYTYISPPSLCPESVFSPK